MSDTLSEEAQELLEFLESYQGHEVVIDTFDPSGTDWRADWTADMRVNGKDHVGYGISAEYALYDLADTVWHWVQFDEPEFASELRLRMSRKPGDVESFDNIRVELESSQEQQKMTLHQMVRHLEEISGLSVVVSLGKLLGSAWSATASGDGTVTAVNGATPEAAVTTLIERLYGDTVIQKEELTKQLDSVVEDMELYQELLNVEVVSDDR